MAYILHLETTTQQCSVALAWEGKCIAKKELLTAHFSHSEKLHAFIEAVLKEGAVGFNQLDAIAISKGPGSYTGLRIGVAAAKGLCFALDLPLIAINTLELMVQPFFNQTNFEYFVPMLDARRMEVYSAVFNRDKKQILETQAVILTADTFEELLGEAPCLLIGNGALKFQSVMPKIKAHYTAKIHYPTAKDMIHLAWDQYQLGRFETLATFEPYYLKDFQVTPSKK